MQTQFVPEVGAGVVFPSGASNAREGFYTPGEHPRDSIRLGKNPIPTPEKIHDFLNFVGMGMLRAHTDRGAEWGVVGAPGIIEMAVNDDGTVDQQFSFTNGSDELKQTYRTVESLIEHASDPAVKRLLESGDFQVATANDGTLGALATAYLFAKDDANIDAVGYIIAGTGVGSGIARRNDQIPGGKIWNPAKGAWEGGHIPVSYQAAPYKTIENIASGMALKKLSGRPAKDLPAEHALWSHVGPALAYLAEIMMVTEAPKLIAVGGGVGIGAGDKYRAAFEAAIQNFPVAPPDKDERANPVADRLVAPVEIRYVPKSMSNSFEMYGAALLISHLRADIKTRQLIRDSMTV